MGNKPEYRRAYQQSERYKAWRRSYRKRINYADAHKYEKSVNGFLMRLYRNMKSRVTGVQKLKAHLYKGKPLLPKEDFYKWAHSCECFKRKFTEWEKSGYDRKLTPTVNRIDSKKGYTLDNVEWLTHSENSRLTSRLRKKI